MTIQKSGLALDIDETLSWTLGHWIEEMQKRFGNPENLSVRDLIAKYRYPENVPYWQTQEALDWKEDARNNDSLQTQLGLMPGAAEGVAALIKIVPISVYITVRPVTILNGTKVWLKKYGFPTAEIIAKPVTVAHADGNKWKAEKLVELYPRVQGVVDDNAGLLQFLPADYKGHVFLYNHKTIPDTPLENVYACPDWKSVVQQVEQVFSNTTR